MSIEKLDRIARTTHRLCVILMLVLGMTMAYTGMVMKFTVFILTYVPFLYFGNARTLHNFLSPFFGVLLVTMMITGGYMYIYPWLLRRKMNMKKLENRN